MKKIALKIYDGKRELRASYVVLKYSIKNSFGGLLIAAIYIAALCVLDFIGRKIIAYTASCSNKKNHLLSNYLREINTFLAIRHLDYFRDIIVIVTGVLGVILALFFTTFLNIITTKYSNTNNAIINELIEQKVINKYYRFLAALISSAILFQFLLVFGYNPTAISILLFTFSIIVGIFSFLFFGRFSLTYFNTATLATDIIIDCDWQVNRLAQNKKHYNTPASQWAFVNKIVGNIDKVRLIVLESALLQMANTAFDRVSDELREFAIRYAKRKKIIPSTKNWHRQAFKYKKWEEAGITEQSMRINTGSGLIPEEYTDYLYTEKQIIDIQFSIFEIIKKDETAARILYDQHQYLQIISYEANTDLFEYFASKLEDHVYNTLSKKDKLDLVDQIQYVQIFTSVIISYFVGFFHNATNIIHSSNIKKLAKRIHYFEETDSGMSIPYHIRIWMDKYQVKLNNEQYNEGRVITTLEYTEYELAWEFQRIVKDFIEKAPSIAQKHILSLVKRLKKEKLLLNALKVCLMSLELHQKTVLCSGGVKGILEEISSLSFKDKSPFEYKKEGEVLEENNSFRASLMEDIWKMGTAAYELPERVEIPDIYGDFYQVIIDDILAKLLNPETKEIEKYLDKFFFYNFLYIDSLKKKIDPDPNMIDYSFSKLYSPVIDLFEISSIAIFISKLQNKPGIIDAILEFWNHEYTEVMDLARWKLIVAVYNHSKSLRGTFTGSSVTSNNRKRQFEGYVRSSPLVFTEPLNDGPFKSFMHRLSTKINDPYVWAILDRIEVNQPGFGLDNLQELFIEFFLRTRISLRSLNIKQTSCGKRVEEHLG